MAKENTTTKSSELAMSPNSANDPTYDEAIAQENSYMNMAIKVVGDGEQTHPQYETVNSARDSEHNYDRI